MHVEEHEVRVLNQLLHPLGKPRAGRPIDHPVIRTDAEADSVSLLDSDAIRVRIVVDKLGDPMRLSDRDNGSLRAQNRWNKVPSTDIADALDTKSAIIEITLCQSAIRSLLGKILEIAVNLEDALSLDGFDVRDSEAIRTVNSYAEVVIMLHHVALDVSLAIQVVIYV